MPGWFSRTGAVRTGPQAVVVVMVGSLTLAQGGVAGDWEMKLSTETGVTTWQARFEQSGDRSF